MVAKKRFKRVQVSSVHSGSANSLGNEAVEPRLLGGDHGLNVFEVKAKT